MPGKPAIIRAQADLDAGGSVFSTPVVVDTYDSEEITFGLNYILGGGTRPLMKIEHFDYASGTWKGVTLQDGTITVAAGVGFINDIDNLIIRGPGRTFAESVTINVSSFSTLRVSFAEEDTIGVGSLGVTASWSLRRKDS